MLMGEDSTRDDATRIVGAALDAGINYVDTAPNYGDPASRNGNAEMKLREILATRRREVFLVSKVEPNDPGRDGVLFQIEDSLRRLGVDALDLVHIHHLPAWPEDLVLARGGTLEGLRAARDRGLVRFVGTSGHTTPRRFVDLIGTGEIDVTMNPQNFVDRNNYGFEDLVLPAARAQGTGIVAMKVLGGITGGVSLGARASLGAHVADAIRFTLGIPGLATAVIGFVSPDQVRAAADIARGAPLSGEERAAIIAEGARLAPARRSVFGDDE
jgi:aryl-alcohol dehydrogenase-like predicted oxidoreductase